MEDEEVSFEEAQRRMDDWYAELPLKIQENYDKLKKGISKFETFQIIANISHYNHQHDTKQYTDYREDRMFIIAEIVAILCLNQGYKESSEVDQTDFQEEIKSIQNSASKYFGMQSAYTSHTSHSGEQTTLEKITNKLKRDEVLVRNPGHPEHHLIFAIELFNPLDKELTAFFGFTVDQGILIRSKFSTFLNERFLKEIEIAKAKATALKDEVVRFRNTKFIDENSDLTREQFIELQHQPSKKVLGMITGHYLNEIFINLKKIHGFTAIELAEYCNVPINAVESFLSAFSITFSNNFEQEPIASNTVLKSKPILRWKDTFMVPSLSLLTWCVEPAYETYIKSNQKLSNRYKDIKHDFLLEKGIDMMKSILTSATFYPNNLYYMVDGKDCETDGLIAYDTTLFIIEAKGQRISNKAKDGNYQRTYTHVNEIIGDSTAQGRRTIDFIRENEEALFYTKGKKEKFVLDGKKFDEFIVISLVLEPIGNLTPLIKVSNDLNYFDEKSFPWIISLYDLIVVADHIDLPILFLHYLRRRKRFLEVQYMSIYEEIDLLAYFLFNGLYIENTLKEANDANIDWLSYDNNTDEINDYYMYKFGHKKQFTPKVQSYLGEEFAALLKAIEDSNIKNRTEIMLEILEPDGKSIKTLLGAIKKAKKEYEQDGLLHDCSIGMLNGKGGSGITYMIGGNQKELDLKLYNYCLFKFDQQQAEVWVGIGDIDPKVGDYNIKCSFVARAKPLES